MSANFTAKRPDFTGGVKSQTHRRSGQFPTFHGFHGFSLEGYACTRGSGRASAHTTLPQREPVKSVKSVKSPAPSAPKHFTPTGFWCEIGCEILGWLK